MHAKADSERQRVGPGVGGNLHFGGGEMKRGFGVTVS